jgi:hypothetical protein
LEKVSYLIPFFLFRFFWALKSEMGLAMLTRPYVLIWALKVMAEAWVVNGGHVVIAARKEEVF